MSIDLDQQMLRITQQSGVILLYHSISLKVPEALEKTLHNVTPRQFEQHLRDLSDYFRFVSLQEFSQAASKAGLATITFDDGYKNVLENAMPIMNSFNYPCTVFLNPVTFKNHWNWRDKVRYLIHHRQVETFLKTHDLEFTDGRFYRYSKHPLNNSADLDRALDQFLEGQVIDIYDHYPYLSALDLIDNPLVSYGNHSQNHYVLASLNDQQQMHEIQYAHEILSKFNNLTVSDCFSAPFGGISDINSTTLNCIWDLSYQSLLMSRQMLQPRTSEFNKVQILERLMPRSSDIISEIISAKDSLSIRQG